KTNRIWEIDFLRGVAIIFMSLFHLLYDLSEFYKFNIDYTSGVIDLMGETSALMFITLTGISCSLSKNNLKRGLKILFFALTITIVTYIYDVNTYINFGILHLLGISILLHYLFRSLKTYQLLLAGTIIIIVGNIFSQLSVSTNYLIPFGLTSPYYAALDYYPLLPYFGVFLYGMVLKNVFYPQKRSLFKSTFNDNLINMLGRHSLFIYLTHQPVILAILFLQHKIGLLETFV
ncbi:MAG: hypothetical protein PWP71_2637, partial [Clostridia bacterium]|nr:hypothetical protein [Clostridia bacterium]